MNFDKIYTDITSSVIPKIAEGIQITKEYAHDLFGRYITYLVVSDSIMLILNIVIFILSIVYGIKLFKWSMKEETLNASEGGSFLINIPTIIIFFVSFWNIIDYTSDLTKDIFVPEIRIYEIYSANKDK